MPSPLPPMQGVPARRSRFQIPNLEPRAHDQVYVDQQKVLPAASCRSSVNPKLVFCWKCKRSRTALSTGLGRILLWSGLGSGVRIARMNECWKNSVVAPRRVDNWQRVLSRMRYTCGNLGTRIKWGLGTWFQEPRRA